MPLLYADMEVDKVRSWFGGRPEALVGGEADLRQTGELMRFTISANMAGIPAVSVPVGHSAGGAHTRAAASVPSLLTSAGLDRI